MKVSVFEVTNRPTSQAVSQISQEMRAADETPSLVIINSNCSHDADQLQAFASTLGCPVHGATSCLGAMSQRGHQTDQDHGLSVFSLTDNDGDFGTASAPFVADAVAEDVAHGARQATLQALEAAGRPGEAPDLVWVTATPGQEEEVIAGIQSVLGTETPIVGGSAADNSVEGNWYIYDQHKCHQSGVVISVLFTSGDVTFAYQNGYTPTETSGVVTKSDGRRVLEIDGKPAREVYDTWTKAQVMATREAQTENILAASTFHPLGREIARLQDVPYYLLAHPAQATDNNAIDFFAAVNEGDVVTQMTGNIDELSARAGRVASQAAALCPEGNTMVGALMVYCGGCMLGVQSRMDTVVTSTRDALGDTPFQGIFTFGEQGPVFGSGNHHGNLMISCVVFSEART